MVSLPRLKRIAPTPTLSETPIAARTGESSIVPNGRLNPVDAATPSIGPNMSAPILPTNDTLRVLGNRCVGMAIKHDAIAEPVLQRLPEAIAQGLDALHLCKVCGYRAGRPEPDSEQCALGAGAPAPFVAGAVDQRLQLDAAP